MRKFLPLLTYLAMLLALFLMAFIGEVRVVAYFFGALLAFATDPIIIVVAVAIGLVFASQLAIIGTSFAFALLLSILIPILNEHLGSSFTLFKLAGRFIAILGIALVANLLKPQSEPSAELSEPRMSRLKRSLHAIFTTEKEWRIYVVLQLVAIVVVIFIDITNARRWDLLPTFLDSLGNWNFYWDFLDSRYWSRHPFNWAVLGALFGPILLTKAYSWISAAEGEGRESDRHPKDT